MTREEAAIIIKECKDKGFKHTFYTLNEYHTALDMAIKALEQEPCEDAISRQAVLEIAYDMSEIDGEHFTEPYRVVDSEDIQKLPPVTPQPKVGKWIRVDKDKCKCDQCEIISFIAMYPNGNIDYCPNCGAKMEVGK